jgi:cytochrome c biogenesis protein CcdA/thiol-disulfide isomerase/thioredoxin
LRPILEAVVLLAGFALLAGAATAVSPCVLPVLPIALSAGATGGHRRPLGVVVGLATSFAFATVALAYVIHALGLPNGLTRTLAICVLLIGGIVLILPGVAARVEARLSRLVRVGPRVRGEGFWSGVVIGVGLGFVYAPCAGPILAGVITLSASQSFSAARFAIAFAYGIGAAVSLYVLMLLGRRVSAPLRRRSGRVQQVLGGVMVVIAALMLANLDTRFETAVANDLPSFLVNPTGGLERSHTISGALTSVRGGQSRIKPAADTSGKLPVLAPAPEFAGLGRWFNSSPLTLGSLAARHRVVLVDFWTYSCVNCLRTLPQLEAWDARYRTDGLTIVGVHTPEFPFEHSSSNVAAAISQNGIHYPVAQDNDAATWSSFGNQYWPAEYLIDTSGNVRYVHFGEGNYATTEGAIRSLLREAGATNLPAPTQVNVTAPPPDSATPESYLGAARAQRFANGAITVGSHDYSSAPQSLSTDQLAYTGRWNIASDAATAGPGAHLYLRFHARRVFIVLGPPSGHASNARILLDGRPIPSSTSGQDVHGAIVRVDAQRLYTVVSLPSFSEHLLEVDPAPGTQAYSFTFG